MKKHSTLAIETSCDDTSIWIINFDWNTFTVKKLLAYSQVQEHNEFGWVVPEIASRLHSEKIIAVLSEIGLDKIKNVDSISVTTHPGLPWSLVVWKTVASLLWEYFNKPIIPVNHIVWHVFALFLERNIHEIKFPMILLTASWWHNNIYHVTKDTKFQRPQSCKGSKGYKVTKLQRSQRLQGPCSLKPIETYCNLLQPVETLETYCSPLKPFVTLWNLFKHWIYNITQIWQTLDDAAWECFDKVSRMLWWPYPWWVRISEQAKLGKPNKKFELNRVRLSHEEFNFSFSGVKSQINKIITDLNETNCNNWNTSPTGRGTACGGGGNFLETFETCSNLWNPWYIQDIAYEFQESVVEVLAKKLVRAALKYWAKTIWLSGWVSANDRLQEYILELLQNKQRLKNQSNVPLMKGEEGGSDFNPQLLTPTQKIYCTDNAAMIFD